jgi:ribokinase
MSSVVVVGSCNVDLVVRAPRHPLPGETLMGSGFAMHPGGKGANQAVAAARAGAAVAMIGRLGPDAGADLLRRELVGAGVDVRAIGTCTHDPSGTALITVADSGENTIIVVPGANAKLRPVHVDDAAPAFVDAAVVLAQLEIPIDVVIVAFTCARANGARTILNAAPSRKLSAEILALVDILVVNETELLETVGVATRDPQDWPVIGSIETIVLTLGHEGVVFGAPGSTGKKISGHVLTPVDTTAAGDTFCGYLAAGLAAGVELDGACRRANAAAAIACLTAGAQPSIPIAEAVDAFLASA